MLVLVTISMSLVLTYAFTRTQATSMQIGLNVAHREEARQAAHTGAAVALERMQAADWAGVTEIPAGVINSDDMGTVGYRVTYEQYTSANTLPADAALRVVLKSVGYWQATTDARERVECRVEVVVRLSPRVPGRTIKAGDSANASDRKANPGDYDTIQGYSLYTTQNDSLTLDPGDRIEGTVRIEENVDCYLTPKWSSTVVNQVLSEIGTQHVTTSGSQNILKHPHPLAAQIEYRTAPSSSNQTVLGYLKTPWTVSSVDHTQPTVSFANWSTYRLYAGGFQYSAVQIPSNLSNVTLRPTAENPLGIFYCPGSVNIQGNVTIQGTLVATHHLQFMGNKVYVSSFDWRDANGEPLIENSELWSRLPAVIADETQFQAQSGQLVIEGAIVNTKKMQGTAGNLLYTNALDLTLTGAATAWPTQQPFSIVQLQGSPVLTALTGSENYAIWLDNGTTGEWYTITAIDLANRQLTVRGEVKFSTATTYRIARRRLHFVELRGPVFTENLDTKNKYQWELTGSTWNERYSSWQSSNFLPKLLGLPTTDFIDWLANPLNFALWGSPYSTYGLKLEPTFHLRNTTGIHYRWEPPLFTPFQGTGADAGFSGYRWRVLSWREVQP